LLVPVVHDHREQCDVMAGRELPVGEEVPVQGFDPVRQTGLLDLFGGDGGDVRQLVDRAGEVREPPTQFDVVRAGTAADVEQPAAGTEIDRPGEVAGGQDQI